MARSKAPSEKPRTELRVPPEEAKQKLEARVSLGEKLLSTWGSGPPGVFPSSDSFDGINAEHKGWSDYNEALLESLFTTEEPRNEYDSCAPGSTLMFLPGAGYSVSDDWRELRERFTAEIRCLRSITSLTGVKARSARRSRANAPILVAR